MKSIYRWGLLAVIACMALSILIVGCGQKTSVVAKINRRAITRDEYVNRLELTQVQAQGNQMTDAGAVVLQQLIDEELILELAEKNGVKPTDSQVSERIAETKRVNKQLATVLKDKGISDEEFKQNMTIKQAIFNLQTKGVKLDEKEVKAYYDQHKMDPTITKPEQRNVSVIITKDKVDAGKAMQMLAKNIEFGTVARQLSIQTQTAQSGGAVPVAIDKTAQGLPFWITKGVGVIFKTDLHKTTQPVEIGKGVYAIYQVTNVIPAKTTDLKDVQYAIREYLMKEKGQERKNDFSADLEKMRKESKIDINVDRYKKLFLQKSAAGEQ